jgi:UDP-3-O-[3-hydroxymyristoyl] N-acetylglucosamine deacetylase
MKDLKISGITMHSGVVSNITVKPTKSGGIVFVRNGVDVPAVYKNVHVSGLRNTTVGMIPNNVQTIEHLMAALFISGVTNAKIIIDNVEPPIVDGGAEEFTKLLESLGIKDERKYLVVKKEIVAKQSELKMPWFIRINNFIRGRKQSDRFVKLSPTKKHILQIDARLVYPDKIIGEQSVSFVFDYDKQNKSQKDFLNSISMCRTFGTVAEWEWLKKHGMGRGANEHNVIALGTIDDLEELQKMGIGKNIKKKDMFFPKGSKVGALTGLHYRNEFVRHKIIDTFGDLYTSGYSVIGKVESNKGSHALNNLVLKKLFSDKSNYDIL